MNTKRLIVLGLAGVMAIAAAPCWRAVCWAAARRRSKPASRRRCAMSDVLVASTSLQPGQALTADEVRWQKWPAASVDSTFITQQPRHQRRRRGEGHGGAQRRIIAGQPITNTAIVHGDAAGFMAAMLTAGHARRLHHHQRRFGRRRVHPAQ